MGDNDVRIEARHHVPDDVESIHKYGATRSDNYDVKTAPAGKYTVPIETTDNNGKPGPTLYLRPDQVQALARMLDQADLYFNTGIRDQGHAKEGKPAMTVAMSDGHIWWVSKESLQQNVG